MMRHEAFCAFILSNGRPDQQSTLKVLDFHGYTGDWRIVVDDEDPTLPEYLRRYGEDRITVFSKADYVESTDVGDNFPSRMTAVFARNACFDIARDMGIDYFLELDDDYLEFAFRYETMGGTVLDGVGVTNLDEVFDVMLDWLDDSGADSVALCQGGDYIGGALGSRWKQKLLRKAMNTWFFRTDSDVRFMGRMNDDVATYTTLSTRGRIFFTTMYCHIRQIGTQSATGGMSGEYAAFGTYVKTFYAVMACPSAVKVSIFNTEDNHPRIHHEVRWRTCAPKILHESHRKGVESHV